jgi:hypothetical protein
MSIDADHITTRHLPQLFTPARITKDGIAYGAIPTFKQIDEMTSDRIARRNLKAEARLIHQEINRFLFRHNKHQAGSTRGYTAYFAAYWPPDGRELVDRLVIAAKVCPLHTPTAADFFAKEDLHTQGRNVYCLQRLAGHHASENLMSNFLGWLMRFIGKADPNIHLVATYADTGVVDPRNGRAHQGLVFRASGAIYCGLTEGRRLEGYLLNGRKYSRRRGPETLGLDQFPVGAQPVYSTPKQRWCYAVGPNRLVRALRYHALKKRMEHFEFVPIYQPRLLARLLAWLCRATSTPRRWSGFLR